MAEIANLLGQRFGALIVISEERQPRRRVWACRCDCGNRHVVTTGNLRNGSVSSCGCRARAAYRSAALVHGDNRGAARTKEYRSWAHIRGRCTNPGDRSWDAYGGRGITVCERWASFPAFLEDMGRAPSTGHSVERIDNDLGYSPSNCRWATRAEQARNTRRTVRVEDRCLKDVCEERGLSYDAVQARIRRGHPLHLALSALTGHAYRALLPAPPTPQESE